jgi:RNA-directed DNA polymerase
MFTYEQIYRCYLNCRKNKRNTINQLEFEVNADMNLLRLQEELNNRTYKPESSIYFILKKPKLREVFAATFRDRVVHHILVEYLNTICEPRFIFDSYACRVGKGTHASIKRLQKFSRSATKNNTQRAYYMQLDIRSFFVEINKDILENIVKKQTNNEETLWLAKIIIWNDCTIDRRVNSTEASLEKIPKYKSLLYVPKNKGIPIGNLSSQFFANLYLNELDQYIKRTLKCRWYIRYMDDLVLLSEDKNQLIEWMILIEKILKEKLDLSLHPTKRIIAPVSNGIDFVGYVVRPNYILVRKRVIGNLKYKIFNNTISLESWNSYMGHFKHAQTNRLRVKLKKLLVKNKINMISPKLKEADNNVSIKDKNQQSNKCGVIGG